MSMSITFWSKSNIIIIIIITMHSDAPVVQHGCEYLHCTLYIELRPPVWEVREQAHGTYCTYYVHVDETHESKARQLKSVSKQPICDLRLTSITTAGIYIAI